MWTSFILQTLGALLLIFASANIIDWIASGTKWAHKYYATTPDIWRPFAGGDEKRVERRVALASIGLTALFSFMFVIFFLVLQPGVAAFRSPIMRAVAVALVLWLLIPAPIIATQHLLIKYHRASTVAQLVAWFAKLFVASVIMTHIL